MAAIQALPPEALRGRCPADSFEFSTTDELEEFEGILGQPRALEAIEFGIEIEQDGYNIFAFGPDGTGKHSVVRQFLEQKSASEPTPPDCCYVNNFDDSHSPKLLRLPAGRGAELRRDMEALVEELTSVLRAAFESETYQTQRQKIDEAFKAQQEKSLEAVEKEAQGRGLTLLRTPVGMVFAPLRDDEVLTPDDFQELPETERAQLAKNIEELQEELQRVFRRLPEQQRRRREQIRELNGEVSSVSIGPLFQELREKYAELDVVVAFLDAAQHDVVTNARALVAKENGSALTTGTGDDETPQQQPSGNRYLVNVIVDHGETEGAPVVYEDHPTFPNLVGRVEHKPQMGALVTDFDLIKPGALHRANGGYLLLDALKLLTQPYGWDGLKRALRSRQLRIESVGQALSLISTYSLEPEPIPLSIKIVLLGEPRLYYLLAAHDPDFPELFKVAADFASQVERDAGNQQAYAAILARLIREKQLKPFDREAVAHVVEHSSRMSGDNERLSLLLGKVLDLLREADHWAGRAESEVVRQEHVREAIEHSIYRSDRLSQRYREEIARGTILLDTEGEVVGQINGLAVIQLGDHAFGRPSRITARARLGSGRVVDIEREVELSGPLHSKGVLILSAFLGGRYAAEMPLSLAASLVFEQSYTGVDGDSASSAELYALLSAIADLPLSQSFAVTGSVNQLGEVQAIGGVNEKIEGFFDVCAAKGLTGKQAVLIPQANVKHLMLRPDVVEAVEQGRFAVYSVATIDEGIELLSGVPAGTAGDDGSFPEGTVNQRVQDRLRQFAETAKSFAGPSAGGDGNQEEPR